MYSVVITHSETGKVVAQVRASLRGQNYTPIPAQYRAAAWRTAINDKLVEPDADHADYDFELVPVSIRDVFSNRRK